MQDPDSKNLSGQSDRVQEILAEATRLMASAELEFEAKGYPASLTRIAVSRAQAVSQYRVAAISQPTLKAEAFMDTLKSELIEAEDWILRNQAFLTRQEEKGNETI